MTRCVKSATIPSVSYTHTTPGGCEIEVDHPSDLGVRLVDLSDDERADRLARYAKAQEGIDQMEVEQAHEDLVRGLRTPLCLAPGVPVAPGVPWGCPQTRTQGRVVYADGPEELPVLQRFSRAAFAEAFADSADRADRAERSDRPHRSAERILRALRPRLPRPHRGRC